jgi:hypothetical protein
VSRLRQMIDPSPAGPQLSGTYGVWPAQGGFSMRQIEVALLTCMALILGSCGSSGQPKNINGGWFALLKNPDGSTAFAFQSTLAQGSGTTVNVTNFAFEPSPQCFPSATSEMATFSSTGSSGGVETGTLAMTISTTFPAIQNVLTLAGTRNAAESPADISGTWGLTGQSGCTALTGSFTMSQPATDPP